MQISGKKQKDKKKKSEGATGGTSSATGGGGGGMTRTGSSGSSSLPPGLPTTAGGVSGSLLSYTEEDRVTWLLPGMCVLRNIIPVNVQQQIVDEAFRFGQQSHLSSAAAASSSSASSTDGASRGESSSSSAGGEKITSRSQVLDSGFYTTDQKSGTIRLNQGQRGRLIVPVEHLHQSFWQESCAKWIQVARSSSKKSTSSAGSSSSWADTVPEDMVPTIALMNYYKTEGTFKWHVDSEHPDLIKSNMGPPIVSVTIGDSCEFGYKKSYDSETHSSVMLNSGDVLLFGGPARMIVHSVLKIVPSPRPAGLKMPANGRLNVTLRDVRNGKVDEDLFPMYRVSYGGTPGDGDK